MNEQKARELAADVIKLHRPDRPKVTSELVQSEPQAQPARCSVAHDYALLGRCDTCGNITAIDLDGSPKHEREMQMKGRTVERVTREEARAAAPTMKRCDHKALVAELRAKLSQHNVGGEPPEGRNAP